MFCTCFSVSSVKSMCLYYWTSGVMCPGTSGGLYWTCWSRVPPLCQQDTGQSSLTFWCPLPPWPSVCPLPNVHDGDWPEADTKIFTLNSGWISSATHYLSGEKQFCFCFFTLTVLHTSLILGDAQCNYQSLLVGWWFRALLKGRMTPSFLLHEYLPGICAADLLVWV